MGVWDERSEVTVERPDVVSSSSILSLFFYLSSPLGSHRFLSAVISPAIDSHTLWRCAQSLLRQRL